MTVYALPPLVGTLAFASLAVFLITHRPKSQPKRLLALLCVQTVLWQASWLASFFVTGENITLVIKIAYIGISLMPFTYYHFVVSYLDATDREKIFVRVFYSAGIALIALIPTHLFISGYRTFDWWNFSNPGPIYPLFIVLAFCALVRGLWLLKTAVQTENARSNQTKYLFAGFALFFLCTLDFLQVYGAGWYPIGVVFHLLSFLVVTYGIAKHHLLDIRIAIQKTFVYSIIILFLSMSYLAVVFGIHYLIRTPIGWGSVLELLTLSDRSLLIHMFLAHVISCVMSAGFAVYVYLRAPKRRLNITFALFTASIALYSGPAAFAVVSHDEKWALWLWRIAHFGVTLAPVTFLFFVMTLSVDLRQKSRRLIEWASSAFAVIFLFLGATGILNPRVAPKFYYRFYTDPDAIYYCYFGIWLAMMSYGTYRLIRIASCAEPTARRRQYLFTAFLCVAFLGGGTNFLPTMGLNVPILNPFGTYAIPIYFFAATYIIATGKVLDINIIIKRTFVYFVFALVISLSYIGIIFVVHHFFVARATAPTVFMSFVLVLIIACLIKPIEILLHRFLEKRFFRGTIGQISEEKERLQFELERRERLKSVGILASGMAHEIKNPLTAINTFVDYLEERHADPAFRKDFHRIVKGEVGRIGRIVQDLLDFSKPRSPQMREADLNKIIRDVLELLSKDMLQAGVRVAFETNLERSLLIDPDQMKQALLNIILNAVDAMKGRAGDLKICVHAADLECQIQIIDQGCGIAPEKLARIFDPFYSEKDGGTGLGLAVTHSIIEQHSGRVFVQSELGKGTVFRIVLPLPEAREER